MRTLIVVDLVLAEIADAAVPVVRLGVAGGTRLTIAGPEGTWINSPMDQITTTWRDRLPVALGEGTSQA